jgi:hypothetical protein
VRARQQRPDAGQARLAVPGVRDVGRRDLVERLADATCVGALVEGGLDADTLVDGAPDLGRGRGRVLSLDDGAADDDVLPVLDPHHYRLQVTA